MRDLQRIIDQATRIQDRLRPTLNDMQKSLLEHVIETLQDLKGDIEENGAGFSLH